MVKMVFDMANSRLSMVIMVIATMVMSNMVIIDKALRVIKYDS